MNSTTYIARINTLCSAIDKLESLNNINKRFYNRLFFLQAADYGAAKDKLLKQAIKENIEVWDKYTDYAKRWIEDETGLGKIPKGVLCGAFNCPIATAIGEKVITNGDDVLIGGDYYRWDNRKNFHKPKKEFNDPLLSKFIKRFDRGFYPQLILERSNINGWYDEN